MSTLKVVRRSIYRILDAESRDSRAERASNIVLAALIAANVVAVILETVPELHARFEMAFATFEALSLGIFTLEYVLRIWTAPENARFRGPLRGRIRFLVTPMAIVDLMAILPAYLPGEVFWDLRYVRALRLVRMMRVLKAARYSQTLRTFGNVLRRKRDELAVIGVFLLLLLVLASSSMYFAEHEAQPSRFSSIPAAMWWAVTTLTTVGYGDVVPVTPWGKVLGSAIAIIGIGIFALPTGILAAAFAEEVTRRRRAPAVCPHCGKEVAVDVG